MNKFLDLLFGILQKSKPAHLISHKIRGLFKIFILTPGRLFTLTVSHSEKINCKKNGRAQRGLCPQRCRAVRYIRRCCAAACGTMDGQQRGFRAEHVSFGAAATTACTASATLKDGCHGRATAQRIPRHNSPGWRTRYESGGHRNRSGRSGRSSRIDRSSCNANAYR